MSDASDWIKSQLDMGVPPEQIKASMVKNGWNPYVVENMIEEASGKDSPGKKLLSYDIVIVLAVVSVVIISVLYFIFPSSGSGGSLSPGNQDYPSSGIMVLSAEQLYDSMDSRISEKDIVLDYLILGDGERFYLEDTVDKMVYNSTTDSTEVVFEWDDESFELDFQGDLEGEIGEGDTVRVDLTVKTAIFSEDDINYRMDFFEEQKISEEDLLSGEISGNPLPQSCIEKI